MSMAFKMCPDCGAEHVPTAQVCSDCGVALEVAPAELPTTGPLPPASELTRVATGGPWELERLAFALQEAGISSRIDALLPAPSASGQAAAATRGSSGSGARLALYVLAEDEDPARREIQDLLLQTGGGASARGSEALENCPACDAPISGASSACSDCGLEFVPVEDVCASCGAVSSSEVAVCPSCGAPSRPEDAT